MAVDPLWHALHAFALRETGMNLSSFVAGPALTGLAELAAAAGLSREAFLQHANHDERSRIALITRVANGTSWFFREWSGFETLLANAKRIRRETGRNDIRVWCAGCSSGQEAYSIAVVLLDEGFVPHVVGSDIDASSIRRAEQAAYRTNDLLRMPAKYARYFDGTTTPVRVSRRVRDCVQFTRHSLFPTGKPPTLVQHPDVIMCRHVLMYFDRSVARNIVAEMQRLVPQRAALILAAIEQTLQGTDAVPMAATANVQLPVPLQARASTQNSLRPLDLDLTPVKPIAEPPVASDAAAQLALGLQYKQQDRFTEACAALRISRFLTRDEHWLAPYQLGVCLERLGDLREAAEAYRHALLIANNGGSSGMTSDSDVEAMRSSVIAACQERLRVLG
jgi:chemotaxis protein methyltransferase CheR